MTNRLLLLFSLLLLLPSTAGAGEPADRWIAQLGSRSYLVRARAARRLELLGPRVKPRLVAALRSPDLETRAAAGRLIARLSCHQWEVRAGAPGQPTWSSSSWRISAQVHVCRRCGLTLAQTHPQQEQQILLRKQVQIRR